MVNTGVASLDNEHPFSPVAEMFVMLKKKRQGVKRKYWHTPKGDLGRDAEESSQAPTPGPQSIQDHRSSLPGPLHQPGALSLHLTAQPRPAELHIRNPTRLAQNQLLKIDFISYLPFARKEQGDKCFKSILE